MNCWLLILHQRINRRTCLDWQKGQKCYPVDDLPMAGRDCGMEPGVLRGGGSCTPPSWCRCGSLGPVTNIQWWSVFGLVTASHIILSVISSSLSLQLIWSQLPNCVWVKHTVPYNICVICNADMIICRWVFLLHKLADWYRLAQYFIHSKTL